MVKNPLFELGVGGLVSADVVEEGLAIDAQGVEGHLIVSGAGSGVVGVKLTHGIEAGFLPETRKMKDTEWAGDTGSDERNNLAHSFLVRFRFDCFNRVREVKRRERSLAIFNREKCLGLGFFSQLGPRFFEEFFGGDDAIVFGEDFAFILNSDVAVVAVFEDDFEGFEVVSFGFVTRLIKFVGFGGNAFGEGHEVVDALVSIVVVEISEVWEGAAVVEIDLFEDLGHPCSVGREAAVVFNDDVDFVILSEGGEGVQTFDAIRRFCVVGWAFTK